MLTTALAALTVSTLVPAQLPKEAMSGYSRLLARTVDRSGRVDYDKISAEYMEQLDGFLSAVANAKEPEDKNEALGMYIDAYNAIVIKAVISHKMPPSVLKVEGFFDKMSYLVAGERTTLDRLEKVTIKRVSDKDARTHMVLVCGAIGCPILEQKPYSGSNTSRRMDAASRRYLRSAAGTKIASGAIQLSEIFKWYKDDFGGPSGVLEFVKKYVSLSAKKKMGDAPKVSYLRYNWNLNKK